MVAENEAGEERLDGAAGELLTLQHLAQHAPIHELAQTVAIMFNDLDSGLELFNQLMTGEPCSCGCTPTGIEAVLTQVAKLSIHIAVYSMALGQRNPGGFHIVLGSASADLN